jgi:hypothetical protein
MAFRAKTGPRASKLPAWKRKSQRLKRLVTLMWHPKHEPIPKGWRFVAHRASTHSRFSVLIEKENAMFGVNQFWDERACRVLTKMWDEGFPAREIGERLGCTKDAVIGKAHRLNLTPRESPIRKAA